MRIDEFFPCFKVRRVGERVCLQEKVLNTLGIYPEDSPHVVMSSHYQSWGLYPRAKHSIRILGARSHPLPLPEEGTVLAYGLGRSYGDSCLNDGQTLISSARLTNYIAFDPDTGILKAESGVSLAAILATFVPKGWFLPVTPGTKFVTIGGAIANDIHGKNHHVAGTFGNHVISLGLRRSDGSELRCSPSENAGLFAATIGGLGLTGFITWAEIQLRKIVSPLIESVSHKFRNLDEFFELSQRYDQSHEYSVSWVDCAAQGSHLGRGLFMAGNFSGVPASAKAPSLAIPFPCQAPAWLLNQYTIEAFNTLYYHRQLSPVVEKLVHYDPFFYPLDAILHWNRMYGSRGFFQYQSVVPFDDSSSATCSPVREMLKRISAAKMGSFLAVLKTFGDIPSRGILSFPRKGVTLALDFPNEGERTEHLFRDLDAIVTSAGGALYPAKDARMSPALFAQSCPRYKAFIQYIDPRFSSSFWRRVTERA